MSITDIQNDKLGTLIKTTRFLARLSQSRDGQKSQVPYYQMMANYYTRLREAPRQGDFVVAHTMFFPIEILNAMDLLPMHAEFTGWMMSLFCGNCADSLTKAAEIGLAPEICSAHRLVAGALEMGVLPRPDAVIGSNLVCDNAAKSAEFIMERQHCPGFLFDYPFHDSPSERRFIREEFKGVIAFLESVSGRRMDWARLSRNLAETDKQICLVRQIDNLCTTVPSPFVPQDFLKFLVTDYMFAGQPETTHYLEMLREELAEKAALKQGTVTPEKHRLMGIMIPPTHLLGSIDRICAEHGATIVCYPNLCDWGPQRLNPEDPLEALAQKLAMSPPLRLYGTFDERALEPVTLGVDKYHINGAVNFSHLGCRQMGATLKFFKDALNELNVPLLNIDCDLVDATVTSEEDVRKQLEQFFELLDEQNN
jgi:benzoyl-CoA reductase/2-hydroxyglutaryl-CoA dehydratase subunit BcrC/BadD/HgdB